ncbi:MAG: response regulator transcription factor [Jatrophihabitans sp.]|nr:MAG: response regulator transcription factor [Jatrophihabitans sp.]
MTVRVVLADDQPVVRDGLVLLLTASGEVDVLAAAADGAQAVRLVAQHAPEVALLDLRMPGLDGVGATAAIVAEHPGTRVLVLTTFADDDAILPALRAGAAGYLTKDASAEELVTAIKDVAAGRTVLDPEVQRRLVALVAAPASPAGPGTGGLTRREVEVVRLVAQGLSNRQVAQRLVLSEATVKTHLNHVLAKLDVDGRPGLVAWAWRSGLGGSPD